ncbi:hypothetical protein FA95DRAFT_120117 [Auriscalpium vulgare]|uniref:Uncharacterized protein n=1 Tax=Auriscalpium vulgare TaxID=40419 RepID=A0ACB8RMS1_9AGAM|nr:hypothetical protein FA95DRAFT_120117 [Auriscalpium vulgare]
MGGAACNAEMARMRVLCPTRPRVRCQGSRLRLSLSSGTTCYNSKRKMTRRTSRSVGPPGDPTAIRFTMNFKRRRNKCSGIAEASRFAWINGSWVEHWAEGEAISAADCSYLGENCLRHYTIINSACHTPHSATPCLGAPAISLSPANRRNDSLRCPPTPMP